MSKSSSSRIFAVQYMSFLDSYVVTYLSDHCRRYPAWRVPQSVLNFCCDENFICERGDYVYWERGGVSAWFKLCGED